MHRVSVTVGLIDVLVKSGNGSCCLMIRIMRKMGWFYIQSYLAKVSQRELLQLLFSKERLRSAADAIMDSIS